MKLDGSVLKAVMVHAVLPTIAMIAVTVLAALGKISGEDALLVIIAGAGIGSTAAAGVTGAAVTGQSSTDTINSVKAAPAPPTTPTEGK